MNCSSTADSALTGRATNHTIGENLNSLGRVQMYRAGVISLMEHPDFQTIDKCASADTSWGLAILSKFQSDTGKWRGCEEPKRNSWGISSTQGFARAETCLILPGTVCSRPSGLRETENSLGASAGLRDPKDMDEGYWPVSARELCSWGDFGIEIGVKASNKTGF